MKSEVRKGEQKRDPNFFDSETEIIVSVTTLLGNLKGRIELSNTNTCAEVKLSLFLFMPAIEMVCRVSKVLNTLSFN